MKVITKNMGNAVVARLVGEIGMADSEQLRETLDAIVHENPQNLVLDFSEVSYIASVGLTLLLKLTQELRKLKGRLVIAAATPSVLGVLTAVHMGSAMPIRPTVKSALDLVGAECAVAV